MTKYLIGQRVILDETFIVTVEMHEAGYPPNNEKEVWISSPYHIRDMVKVKRLNPLPNNQM